MITSLAELATKLDETERFLTGNLELRGNLGISGISFGFLVLVGSMGNASRDSATAIVEDRSTGQPPPLTFSLTCFYKVNAQVFTLLIVDRKLRNFETLRSF